MSRVSRGTGPLPGVVSVVDGLQPGVSGTSETSQAFTEPSLAAAVATHGPLPISAVLTLAAGLAEALSTAHAAGYIHGDLTPANVLLAANGPRLTGFATAHAQAPRTGVHSGIPGFMSPEEAEGLEVGPASDIFSLGAVLLYAATGTRMSYYASHLDQLPGELRPFIERCMAVDPAQRPTAAGFLTDLISPYPAGVSRNASPVPMPAETITFGAPKTPTWLAASIGLPAALIRRLSAAWRRRKISRHAWLMGIVALAFAVAGAGVVYVIHPWPYPVLRPTGLTAEKRSTSSISLGWSNPGSGPLPDKYVILRDGAVAGTVPGNVNHFAESGLAPATTYDFRVIAYRGSVRSQSSHNFHVATQKPPLSDAVFNSYFLVKETIEAGAESVQGDSQGETWEDPWDFLSNCTLGPCTAQLSGQIDGQSFTTELTPDDDGNYTGTAQINDYYYCGSDVTNYEDSTVSISISAAAAHAVGKQWEVSKLSGGIDWSIAYNPNGGCGDGQLVFNVTG
jgi:Protein kinase domain/Fibronectin type III domain